MEEGCPRLGAWVFRESPGTLLQAAPLWRSRGWVTRLGEWVWRRLPDSELRRDSVQPLSSSSSSLEAGQTELEPQSLVCPQLALFSGRKRPREFSCGAARWNTWFFFLAG